MGHITFWFLLSLLIFACTVWIGNVARVTNDFALTVENQEKTGSDSYGF